MVTALALLLALRSPTADSRPVGCHCKHSLCQGYLGNTLNLQDGSFTLCCGATECPCNTLNSSVIVLSPGWDGQFQQCSAIIRVSR